MQPLVSICIPTYNRADCLEKTIETIICQPEFQSGEVEIVISDNASNDSTNEVCKRYYKYPNFFYHRNLENVRDQNFPLVLSKAHGKLRKLNNDTFLLEKDALGKLCELVREYNETRPYIYLQYYDDCLKSLNFHDFVLAVSYRITFLASFTIWDDDCENIRNDIDGCELLLWQVKKAYEIAYSKNSVVVYYQKLGHSITPPKKNISYGLYKIFYCNFMSLLRPYVENGSLSITDVDYLEKDLLFSFYPDWILKFELNNTDMQYSKEENLKEAIWNQYNDKPYWNEFERMYNKKLLKVRVKQFIKKVLGRA